MTREGNYDLHRRHFVFHRHMLKSSDYDGKVTWHCSREIHIDDWISKIRIVFFKSVVYPIRKVWICKGGYNTHHFTFSTTTRNKWKYTKLLWHDSYYNLVTCTTMQWPATVNFPRSLALQVFKFCILLHVSGDMTSNINRSPS